MSYLYGLKIILTNFCGYSCKYCYVDTDNRDVVSEELLFKTIDYYLSQKGLEKKIFFLGGESILEFDLLKKSIIYGYKKGQELGKNITFFITTSGLGLGEEKVKFLSNHNIKIGVSIDGNEYVHGLNRISKIGKNTFEDTFSSIKILNKYYTDENLGYAMTVDENNIDYLFESFTFLSNLDKNRRNITIAGVYKKGWESENIILLNKKLENLCNFIFDSIEKQDFYYYNVLSFFILEKIKGNELKKGNIELHLFPNGQLSLQLFAQSILGNSLDDPTSMRFDYVNKIAGEILLKSNFNNNFKNYISSLYSKAIL